MSNRILKPLTFAVGAAFVGSFAMSQDVAASSFALTDLDSGYMLVGDEAAEGEKHAEGKCGEGKCGEDKAAEGKCGEGKCGEGKCGEDKAAHDKDAEGKCGEGKCGEGKCGEEKPAEGDGGATRA